VDWDRTLRSGTRPFESTRSRDGDRTSCGPSHSGEEPTDVGKRRTRTENAVHCIVDSHIHLMRSRWVCRYKTGSILTASPVAWRRHGVRQRIEQISESGFRDWIAIRRNRFLALRQRIQFLKRTDALSFSPATLRSKGKPSRENSRGCSRCPFGPEAESAVSRLEQVGLNRARLFSRAAALTNTCFTLASSGISILAAG
jgi:hypothetical protein